MIAIADYGMGNRRSVEKALAHVGAESVITTDVRNASAIILRWSKKRCPGSASPDASPSPGPVPAAAS